MKIVFFTNFINHHQVYLADELYKLTEGNYYFVELEEMPQSFKNSGYPDFTRRPYVLQAWKDRSCYSFAKKLAIDADVAMFTGSTGRDLEILRSRKTKKITFEVSERWFKKGYKNMLSPHFLKWFFYYHCLFRFRPVYKLCSSAFCANDMEKLHAFKNKCYKWAYFTNVETFDIESYLQIKHNSKIRIMWCARFIPWKHPELVINTALLLKEHGYELEIDMFGSGEMHDEIEKMIKNKNLSDCVFLKNNVPNGEIIKELKEHHIFLFTSDQNEGWGAVANEAMANGCVLVASNLIGSVPYLVKDGKNGLVFESNNPSSCFEKLTLLFRNRQLIESMAINAYKTMQNVWNPQVAAKNLITLIEKLQSSDDTPIFDGPCSKGLSIRS